MKNYFLEPVERPYQFLFPIGVLHALAGAARWIAYVLQLAPYPGQAHASQMIGGFLFSFAAGFLFTAVPRFTGSFACARWELGGALLISVTLFIVDSAWASLAMLLLLALFFVRRIGAKAYPPPPHFLFIPVGLALGMAGAVLTTLVHADILDVSYIPIARSLLYHGVMPAFLLGVGAKLIAMLLGWSDAPIQIQERPLKEFSPHLQASLFVSGFLVELFLSPSVGRSMRAACATWIAFQSWRLLRLPRSKSKLAFWIWTSSWALIIGLWAHALLPHFEVHAAHLVFIGGLGLTTLMVASRVTLAHGGYPLEIEGRSRVFGTTAIILLIAAATRVSAPWVNSYFDHLAYASLAWICGILAWGAFFIPRMFHSASGHGCAGQKKECHAREQKCC